MKKTILINGTFRSGSGAVNDYLSARTDISNPFGDNEFRIVSDPMGLNNLYNACYKNVGLLSSAYAFEEYLNYIKNLQNYQTYIAPGERGKMYNDNLIKFTNNFIKKITKFNYFAIPHYSRVNFNLKSKIKYSIGLKLKKKNNQLKLTNIIVPKNKDFFLKEAIKYIEKIIQKATMNRVNKANIVLNNAIDAINPIESSKYFKNPKIIIVTRDPRDMFSSMKIGNAGAAPNYDVNIFIDWFKHFFSSNNFKSLLKNKKILHINFENFVNEFDKENKKICKFIGLKEKFTLRKNCIFNLQKSKQNVGKSKKFLNKSELILIEKKLSSYLKW